eukprot:4356790-Prymnesium_polylepis.1
MRLRAPVECQFGSGTLHKPHRLNELSLVTDLTDRLQLAHVNHVTNQSGHVWPIQGRATTSCTSNCMFVPLPDSVGDVGWAALPEIKQGTVIKWQRVKLLQLHGTQHRDVLGHWWQQRQPPYTEGHTIQQRHSVTLDEHLHVKRSDDADHIHAKSTVLPVPGLLLGLFMVAELAPQDRVRQLQGAPFASG